jgi:hypothetical protein
VNECRFVRTAPDIEMVLTCTDALGRIAPHRPGNSRNEKVVGSIPTGGSNKSPGQADRAFFRDVLEYPFIDAGHNWLIFALPPAELPCTQRTRRVVMSCS